MDYFDTAKKYRQKDFKRIRSWFYRVFIIVVIAIISWQAGLRDRNDILAQHSTSLLRSQNNLLSLNHELESLKLKSKEDKKIIQKLKLELSAKPDTELDGLLKLSAKVLSDGVSIQKLRSVIKKLGPPSKCQKEFSKEITVITPVFSSSKQETSFFNNGISITAEGIADVTENNVHPWFDENKIIRIRIKYFGTENWFSGKIPFAIKIPFQENILLIKLTSSKVRGSVISNIYICS